MHGTTASDPAFHAQTGNIAYDTIKFSGAPIGEIISPPASPLSMVRHLGVKAAGRASASNRASMGTLLLNLTSDGTVDGTVHGQPLTRPLFRGMVAYVPRGVDFAIDYPAANSALLTFLPADFVTAICRELEVSTLEPLIGVRNDRLAQLITMLESETRTPGFASDLMIDGLMRAITSILARQDGALFSPAIDRIRLSMVKLNRVIDFVEANLDQEIGLGDMAAIAGLSPFHFSRVFKLTTGETPYHFLCSRRLDRARQLLAEGDLPLVELALACGFASQSHFTAAFTKSMGVSPGRYRRQLFT